MNPTLQRNAAVRAAGNELPGILGCLMVFVALAIYINTL